MKTTILHELYFQATGKPPISIVPLAGAGSNRRYFRLSGDVSLIGVIGTDIMENNAFIYLSKHFTSKGLPMPRVHAVSEDGIAYVQDDFGDVALFDIIKNGRTHGVFSDEEKSLLINTIRSLPKAQIEGACGLDFSKCHPQSSFNERSIRWDLNYFKYNFLKLSGIDFQEDLLEDDFDRLSNRLLKCDCNYFMYRDFQSRNVMIVDGEPRLIDFQGGRKGPLHYDVASFLWQAKANIPDDLRNELINEYLNALEEFQAIDRSHFCDELRHFVLFRTAQVLGAYGFRGLYEKKQHFIDSIPYAIRNMMELFNDKLSTEYPYMHYIAQQLNERYAWFNKEVESEGKLTVRVMSFSYRRGIPNDNSGNGGGFVFDCRALNNPGRYKQYQQSTGRDSNVIKFLEDDGGILHFLNNAYSMVDAAVSNYLLRGFTNLMVCFGCTGGQHRSVYSAEHMARHLNEKFNVRIELIHREQGIHEILTEK